MRTDPQVQTYDIAAIGIAGLTRCLHDWCILPGEIYQSGTPHRTRVCLKCKQLQRLRQRKP